MTARATAARGALFAGLVAVMLWPVFVFGSPLLFPDTAGYYRGGGVALDTLWSRLDGLFDRGASLPGGTAGGEAAAPAGDAGRTPPVVGVRSLPFSVFVNATMRMAGVVAPVAVAAAVTAWLVLLLVDRAPPVLRAPVALAAAGLTTAPFYVSQVMPDAWASVLLLAAVVLAARPDLGWARVLALCVAMAFGIVTHYAHIPLGGVLCLGLAVALWRRAQRGRAAVVMVTLIAALAVNVVVSLLIPPVPGPKAAATAAAEGSAGEAEETGLLDRVSVAPARYPIILARTVGDGPGLRYLRETCPTDPRFTICEVYDTFPTDVGAFLWGEEGLRNRATPAQLRRIGNEEVALLWAVFRAHPVDQAAAFARNAWLQFIRFGMPNVVFGDLSLDGPRELRIEDRRAYTGDVGTVVEWVQLTLLAVAAVGVVAGWRRAPAQLRWAVVLLVVGLVVNAVVCGGLSAPVNRYQGRVIWVAVLLGLVLLARRSVDLHCREGRPRHA